MKNIDKKLFLKHFAPTKKERKRKIMLRNGGSMSITYKSEFKFYVTYLPGNKADYYCPKFIFVTRKDLKIIPIPNIYSFLLIPICFIYLYYYKHLELEIIGKILIALMLFILAMQLLLIIPSIANIKKRINEKP